MDRGFVAGRLTPKGNAGTEVTIVSNDYVVVPLYEPIYAGLQNDKQAVGDFLFRRYAHEMLGEYGWEKGMVAYASNQYPNDAAALAAIMPEHGGNMVTFKKAMYARSAAKLGELKPVAGYADVAAIRAAMDTAVKADVAKLAENRRNGVHYEAQGVGAVNTLKHAIFRAYLEDTSDFRTSIYRDPAPADGDGVVDRDDVCAGTPKGAVVGPDGCAVAPELGGGVLAVSGVKGKEISSVSVPVSNRGLSTGVRCVAVGLPEGLAVTLSASGDACVVSGTPAEDTQKDAPFTVVLEYVPADGGRSAGRVERAGTDVITQIGALLALLFAGALVLVWRHRRQATDLKR